MSLYDTMAYGLFVTVSLLILIKSSKVLLLIVSLEMLAIISVVFVMLLGVNLYLFAIVLFVFFVSESLILLSVLYSVLRSVGGLHSSLIFY